MTSALALPYALELLLDVLFPVRQLRSGSVFSPIIGESDGLLHDPDRIHRGSLGKDDKNTAGSRSADTSYDRKNGWQAVNYWTCFGEYDTVLIVQAPDNIAAAALSLAAAGGGALRAAKTTPLMTMEDTIEAMKRAGKAEYTMPG